MHENPDIIIATPGEIFKQSKTLISFYVLGQRILDQAYILCILYLYSGRFVHVCVEMGLKLASIEYVVFDEADRLFEVRFNKLWMNPMA